MSKYTTGEIAKLCGVSVRTVQYYDSRGILPPTSLSEGGRRLYSQEDLDRMKIICFLRSLELPIESIRQLLEEEHPEEVISMLLQEQESRLRSEMEEKQAQVQRITEVRRTLRQLPGISSQSIGDVAYLMENKRKLRRFRIFLILVGLLMDALQVSTFMVGIFTGAWWPFAAGFTVAVALGLWTSWLYFSSMAYLCPKCHRVFWPRFRDSFFAWHTPCTRKLTCTHCGHHGFCVEVYGKDEKHAEN